MSENTFILKITSFIATTMLYGETSYFLHEVTYHKPILSIYKGPTGYW